MSQSEGVYIKPRYPLIYFDDVHSTSIEGIEEEQRSCQEKVNKIRERLAILIAANPRDLMSDNDYEEYGDATNWIVSQLNEIEEDLHEALRKYGKLEVYENILYDWESNLFTDNDYESIYHDLDINSKSAKNIIFPEEKFQNEKERFSISLGATLPNETSLDELFEKGLENIRSEKENIKRNENLVFAIVDNHLFSTYTGQWLFNNELYALSAIKHKLNISLYPYVNKKFIETHPEFFTNSVINYLEEDEKEKMIYYINNPECFSSILNKEYNNFYTLFQKAFDTFLKTKISFHKTSSFLSIL